MNREAGGFVNRAVSAQKIQCLVLFFLGFQGSAHLFYLSLHDDDLRN